MPKAITSDKLLEAVENGTFIKQGHVRCVEGVKYDFRCGSRILKSTYGRPIDLASFTEAEKSKVAVDPGEVVFVLTEERLELPKNMMVQLSPKRKLSHEGVIVLGGFCIDPLYRGNLLVGLYNFASTPFPIIPGKKVIGAVFYELQGDEVKDFPTPEPIEDFPQELIRLIQSYKPIALSGLQDTLAALQQQVLDLKSEFISGREWQREFQASLKHHDIQIGELIESLDAEKTVREKGEDKLTEALRKMEQTFTWIRGAAWVIAGLIALVAMPLLATWFAKLFHIGS